MIKVAVAFTEFARLGDLTSLEYLQQQVASNLPQGQAFELEQIRLGNEFCERLIPSVGQIGKAIAVADKLQLGFALVISNLTDRGLEKIERILPLLPDDSEVVVNDWGTASYISTAYPALKLIAGRLLCKHLKEPRIATPEEDPVVKWPVENEYFLTVLADLNIQSAEVDLAPHTRPPDHKMEHISIGLHLGRGYSARSQVCSIGSLHQFDEDKFSPGHQCLRECLDYIVRVPQLIYPQTEQLQMYQRGTTWFYNYSDRMKQSIATVIERQSIDRVIVSLDWGDH